MFLVSLSLLNCRICSVASHGCPPRGAGRCRSFFSSVGFLSRLLSCIICVRTAFFFYLWWTSWLIYLRRHYYSKCIWLISVFIITSKKDKRTEADSSVCLIWLFWVVFVFILCSFHASKPMWKLYLVWAILSSVTLLYIISKRCNVMSTIKTHKMAPVGAVSSVFAWLF